MKSFAAGALDCLPEEFVGLSAIGIYFISEIFPRLHFGFFQLVNCNLSPISELRMQSKFAFVLNASCLVGYLLCSINVFHLLVPLRR